MLVLTLMPPIHYSHHLCSHVYAGAYRHGPDHHRSRQSDDAIVYVGDHSHRCFATHDDCDHCLLVLWTSMNADDGDYDSGDGALSDLCCDLDLDDSLCRSSNVFFLDLPQETFRTLPMSLCLVGEGVVEWLLCCCCCREQSLRWDDVLVPF